MKTIVRLSTLLIVGLIFTQCQKVVQTTTYTANVPEYMSYDDLRASVKNENSKTLEDPGKIFLYNQYIFINDFEKGIHVYDNSNPENPQHVGFINIPGNVDISIKNGILYADSYVDIVSIDISDPTNVKEVGRAQNVLSYTIPSDIDYNYPVSQIDQGKGVVIGYSTAEVTEKCTNDDCGSYYHDNWQQMENGGNFGMMSDAGTPVSFSGNATNTRSATTTQNGSGIAGSMARFLMIEDYLYVISNFDEAKVFELSGNNLTELQTFSPMQQSGGWGMIETLFAVNGRLFIGGSAAMYAYNVENPANPTYISTYQHFNACDPVVANDKYAFVTLRDGNNCGGFANEMQVLDIENIASPSLIENVQMTNPFGLAIDNDAELVFVCDGRDGLKVYNYAGPGSVGQNLLHHASGMETYDVIAFRNILHVIGREGLHQFQYASDGNLVTLSTIPLN